MEWLLGIGVAAFLYWFFILRPGKLNFWAAAARQPDSVYDYFKSLPCWCVFEDGLPSDYRVTVPKSEWTGPFRLYVPRLGKQIFVFGKHPGYIQAQDEYLRTVNTRS